ncbi:MAG: hypothetical protein CME71_06245 [Halobacteriovorax sp.]|nr:hypothetical protein [Halobacteriovorax sp.]
MNVRAFRLLIWNTVQKEVRSKSFFMAVGLTLGMLGLGYAVMQAFREQIQLEGGVEVVGSGQLIWVYYALVNAWSIFLGLMFGLGCVRSDVTSQVIGQLLALPISRGSYLAARVIGSWILVSFYQVLSFALMGILFSESLKEISMTALLVAPLISFFPTLAAAVLGLFVSLWVGKTSGMILTGVASLGGSWARSHFSSVEDPMANLTLLKVVGLILWIAIPRFAAPHSFVQVLAGVPEATIAWADIAQFGLSGIALFAITSFIFRRRGF